MKRHLFRLALAAASLAASTAALGAVLPAHFKGARFASEARIGLARARAIALKARPGRFTDQELETERGGSGLRYSFDIRNSAGTFEVGVDAKTGAVLENDAEGADAD